MSPATVPSTDTDDAQAVDFNNSGAAAAFDPTSVDFSNASKGFPVIPSGKWDAELTSIGFGTSKTNNPKAKLVFTIVEAGEYEGQKVFADLPLQQKTLWKVQKWLVNMGTDPDDLKGTGVNLSALLSGCVGRACVLSLGSHSYQSETDVEAREFQDVLDVLPAV